MAESVIDQADTAEPYTNASPVTEDEEGRIDLFELFQTLYRGRRTILKASAAILAVATIIAFVLPFQYTSTVSFIAPSSSSGGSMAAALAGQLSAFGGDAFGLGKSSVDQYAGILKSRSIAGKLVKRFDLIRVYGVKKESQAEKMLTASTTVVTDLKSSIITVSVVAKSPAFARDLANAYMDALRETNGRLALSQSSQRRLFFEQQLAKEKDDLADAEVHLKETQEQSGLIAPIGQTQSQIMTIADIRAQIAVRQVQLAALRQSATDQNPELIRLKTEMEDLQGQLSRLYKGGGNESTAAIPNSKVPALQLEFVRKTREVKYHEALFEMLAKQYESARLDESRDAPVLQVLDPASYPDMKSAPKRMFIILGGLIFGFIAGCAWVLVRGPIQKLRSSLARNETS
jgi:tyrosine-protein kinase Etk/Wzc